MNIKIIQIVKTNIICGIILFFSTCFPALAQISSSPTLSFGGIIGYKMAAVSFQNGSAGTTSCNASPATNTQSFTISGIPAGATVKAAYLYWATQGVSDNAVTFNGTNVSASNSWTDLVTITALLGNITITTNAYKADVTADINSAGNGTYTLTSLNSATTAPSSGCCLSGGILLVIYNTTLADANYLNALYMFEGTQGIIGPAHTTTTGQPQFTSVTLNALITQTAAAQFSDIVWQGNSILENSVYTDSLSINNQVLSDANNPANDQMNGSGANAAAGSVYTVDADTYLITPYITTGNTAVKMRARSLQNDYYLINAFTIGLRRFADWGDAPNSYGTLAANNGPLHFINTFPSSLEIGSSVNLNSLATASNESNGQPGVGANLDDDDGNITFPAPVLGATTYTVSVPVTNTTGSNAYLVGYIDFNGNGNFADPGEQSTAMTITATGSYTLTFSGFPAFTGAGLSTYARFRVSSSQAAVQSYLGWAPDGEVEDYPVTFPILPIELINFYAVKQDKQVAINWSTATEINNNYFEVQRSANGIDYTIIAHVSGAGNSNTIEKYKTIDTLPLFGINYYRLKQVDFNGQYTLSAIVSVDNKVTFTDMTLVPNPAKDAAEVRFYASDDIALLRINITDITGRLLVSKTDAARKGNNSIPLDLSGLQQGVYVLDIHNDMSIQYRLKFVKN